MLTLISGGTGGPKLLQGLIESISQDEISVIVNTGEDLKVSGLHVSPDLDTVVYTLAGIIDDEKWYGIKGDSFSGHEMLQKLGQDEILKIGDTDRAVKLYRTLRMENEATLSQVTEEICKGLGVRAKVKPMSDDRVETRIITEEGEMSFHEFWVVEGAEVNVTDVNFLMSDRASPAPGVIETLDESDSIVIGPSNPITSLGPILSIKGIRKALERNREKILAVSPVVGDSPVSGPTGVLMDGMGHEVSPLGVARIYKDFVGHFMLHEEDEKFSSEIEDIGLNVHLEDILMPDLPKRRELSRKILRVLDYQ
ncbi:hypothetical protein AKJ55_01545 [candidate division MSBL1 archaeon SCGC-AAA382M17]|uniref:2-phospho-L-lactate transferase n=1 Tax=candidate division MSBL1 archaeon SCGC-AAA382M17 TaxID=1698284 RepID=A0ABR5TMU1_9EURY|nr:hypothetical protein AKJ55_01545 [candidate division MSBL1 archaeon SCGC-AAA382M17]